MSKVLVVDDIPDNVRLLSYELEDQGYEVLTACNGEKALEVARDQRPDAILLDVMMPSPDGIEVCRRLKRDLELQSIPVILVTAKDLDDDVIKGLDVGAHDYITKPFNGRVLTARLRSALRMKETHDSLAQTNEKLEREIVERTRIASELRESEEKFRKIGASAQDAIVMMDPSGNVSFWNAAAERIFGYAAEEMLGRNVHETLAASKHRQKSCHALSLFRDRGHGATIGRTRELTALKRNGDEFPIELSLAATQIDGKLHGIAVIRDITERKRGERALEESEERFRLAATSVSDLVYVWDVATDRLEWFGDVDTALGFDPDQVPRTIAGWLDLIHPDDRALFERSVERHRTCADPISEEYRIRRKDGAWSQWVDRGTPVLNQRGLPVKWIGACIDVTEKIRAEEQLRQKQEELRQSRKLEAVGQLAGGIAHEFNNLLQAICGYTHFAREGLSPEEKRYQDLELVRKATDRAAALTRQLLGFGRRQILERKNVNANDVVADLTEMIRPVIGEHIEQELKIDGDVGTVHADPGELQQAMLNLCLNARDAMPSGGRLLIRTQKVVVAEPVAASEGTISPGTYVVLSVTDTGCGMTPEIKERVFEPFFTTKEVGTGTGLGLATVYGIVRQHGGTIHLYSEPGQGTTFRVYLPTVDTTPDTAEAAGAVAVAGGTETILVAEDEPLVRELTVRVLKRAGYRVLEARDGEETLRIFDENQEDVALLLLDAVMPKLSGREVFRRIKARMPTVKVVFCTGYDPETAQYCSIAQEEFCVIQKPIDSTSLLRSVREVLDADRAPPVPQLTA